MMSDSLADLLRHSAKCRENQASSVQTVQYPSEAKREFAVEAKNEET